MEAYRRKRGSDGRERVEVRLRGPQLLNHPMYNRSTAFTREERRELGLEGLLPDVVSTMEQQARRAYGNIARKTEPLERFIGLAASRTATSTSSTACSATTSRSSSPSSTPPPWAWPASSTAGSSGGRGGCGSRPSTRAA
jgi:hypothetical protein